MPRHSASQLDERDRSGGTQRRRIARRGSFQGRNSGESEGAEQHVRSQSIKPRENGGLKPQRRPTDIGLSYYLSSGSQTSHTDTTSEIPSYASPEEGNLSDQECTPTKPR